MKRISSNNVIRIYMYGISKYVLKIEIRFGGNMVIC